MDLFDLVAKITLDSSEYEKGIKGAGEGIEGMSSKWAMAGKAAKIAGAATVAAVGASAAAVGALTKQSVQAYAEYEQLAGGVEKIFDKANVEQIFADANNAYKNLNMSVNEYLAAINQTGATFAQTMGDQKGYDTAKMGMQAIADYASGTGRNLNELNDKYALITRSTSSYQSIADQFSGILPATSAGFLEQAQAAGFLSDSYGKLTEVPIEEYQEAVTKMLEKGVKDMGLYGNTARESATTISGSLAMTKSAWQNLVTGFADPDADMGQLMDNLVTAIVGENEGEGLLNNITPAIERAMEGIGTLVEQAAPVISEHLPKMIETLLPSLITAVTQLVVGLITALPTIIAILVEQLPTVLTTVWNAIDEAGYQLIETGANAIANFAEGMWQKFQGLISSARTWAGNVVQSIKSGLGSLYSAGVDLIQGLWNGLQEKYEAMKAWAGETFGGFIDFVKGIFGISSPSKVFREIGGFVGEGFALGLGDNVPMIENASDAMYGATAITPSTGNSGLIGTTEGEFGRVAAILQEWLPQMTNMDIILDSGALVGELTYDIDRSMGRRQQGRSRGNAR